MSKSRLLIGTFAAIAVGVLLIGQVASAGLLVGPTERILIKGDSISKGYGTGNYTDPSPLRSIQGMSGVFLANNVTNPPAFLRLPDYWQGINPDGTPITVATLADEIKLNVANGELKPGDWFIYEDAGQWDMSVHAAPWPWPWVNIYNLYRQELHNMLVEVEKVVGKDHIRLMTMFDYGAIGHNLQWDAILDDGVHTANDCFRDEGKAMGIKVIDMNSLVDGAQNYVTTKGWGTITGEGIHPNVYGNFVMMLGILHSLGADIGKYKLDGLDTHFYHKTTGGDLATIWGFTTDPTDAQRRQILVDLLGNTANALKPGFKITFEQPTYAPGLLEGQDGWTTNNPTHWYVTDPGLEGSYSAWTEAYGYAFRSLAGQAINSSATVSELMSLYPNAGSQGLFILNNTQGNTYAGVWFQDGGNVAFLNAAANAWAGTGKTWTPNETYKLSYNFDFANGQVKFEAKNLVSDSRSFSLGWLPLSHYAGTDLTTAATAPGQLQLGGKFALHDSVTIEYLPGSITGTVSVSDYTSSPSDLGVTIELIQDGVVVRQEHQLLGSNGEFSIDAVETGTYDVAFKDRASLKRLITAVTVDTGQITAIPGVISLTNGDLDGDNEITSTDLSILGLGLGLAGD